MNVWAASQEVLAVLGQWAIQAVAEPWSGRAAAVRLFSLGHGEEHLTSVQALLDRTP